MIDLVTTENYIYAYYMDESGINANSVQLTIDGNNYTAYGVKSANEYLLEATDDIPDLDEPHQITLSVADIYGNTQQVSLSSHLIDPGEEDPDNYRPADTTAYYRLYRGGDVEVRIYNMYDGYLYRTIDAGSQSSGSQSCYWDGLDDYGYPVPQGLYCMEIWYYDVQGGEYIGSVWPDPNTYLPLGQAHTRSGSVSASGMKEYRIWNPTDGKLQVKVSGTSGLVVCLRKTSGKSGQILGQATLTGSGNWRCIEKTPTDHRGYYYYVTVHGNGHNGSYQIYAQFFQQGTASNPKPWNGWWWPTSRTRSGPHTWSDSGAATPLLKFDQVFGTSSRQWEYDNQSEAPYWGDDGSGHCWGWTLASLLHTEPAATTYGGVAFTQEEAKGLVTQLHDQFGITVNQQYYGVNTYPTFVLADSGDADQYAKDVYDVLYYGIRQGQHGLHSDMAQSGSSVPWNYPVYLYVSEVVHVPGDTAGERQHVRLHTTVTRAINSPFPPSSSGAITEDFTYELWLRRIQPANDSPVFPWDQHHYNWVSSSIGVVPRCLRWITGMDWQDPSTTPGSYNSYVTKTRVDAIAPP